MKSVISRYLDYFNAFGSLNSLKIIFKKSIYEFLGIYNKSKFENISKPF